MRVLSRLVEIEAVMGVFERGHALSLRHDARDDFGQECRFAGTAPAGEADDTHAAAYIRAFRAKSKAPGVAAGRFKI